MNSEKEIAFIRIKTAVEESKLLSGVFRSANYRRMVIDIEFLNTYLACSHNAVEKGRNLWYNKYRKPCYRAADQANLSALEDRRGVFEVKRAGEIKVAMAC